MKSILSLFAAVAIFSSCSMSSPEPKPIEEVSNKDTKITAKPAIVQIKQTYNLSSEQSAQALMEMLEGAKIKVSSFDYSAGTLETEWFPTRDSVCGGNRMRNAPLSCRTKLMFKITPLSSYASSVHSTYKENCNFNEDISISCPGSIPEKLILKIAEDLKEVEGNVNPKGFALFQ